MLFVLFRAGPHQELKMRQQLQLVQWDGAGSRAIGSEAERRNGLWW